MSARDLRFEKTRRNAVVAVKLDIIEYRGDAIPAGHRSGLCTAHMRHGSNHHVPEAQGLAYQYDLKLDRSANRQLPGAEKIDAGCAHVALREDTSRSPATAQQTELPNWLSGVSPSAPVRCGALRWH